MDSYSFIVNPAAGKGGGRRVVKVLKGWLRRQKLDHELSITEAPGHATEIAKKSTADVVVAVGGDGTVNEVANGLVGTSKALGILPTGSGNDLVRSIGISRNLEQAFSTLLKGTRWVIDTGTVKCSGESLSGHKASNVEPRTFLNGVGVGFDAVVAERTRHIQHFSGTTLYLIALFQAIWQYRCPQFTMQIDSSTISSKKFLIAIGNGKCVGGGFYLTPNARIDDGLLDIFVVDDLPVSRILALIPKVLQAKPVNAKGVSLMRASTVSISAPTRFFVHADGEIVGNGVQNVHVAIVKRSLNVIAEKL